MIVSGAGDNPPRLNNRIDAALFILNRAKRGAIVEISSSIPVSVPPVLLEGPLQTLHMTSILVAAGRIVSLIAERREITQSIVEEPAHPNTFTLAQMPNTVHAIVPIAA